jgi:NADPH:quinone reductase-like Zn-dependent oxidoreductase
MRVYELPKAGAGIDTIVQAERPRPKPSHRQVLVKVAACSLNYRDLVIARSDYRMPVRPNLIPLSDGAGEVIEVGPDVLRVKAGDRVAGNFFQRWEGGEPGPHVHTSALGGGTDGMLAEYVVLEEDGVVKIPAHLSFEEAASLPCAGVTAWNAIVEHARLIAGQTLLVQGTGGVSILGLQLARAMGITVIVTSSSDEKLKRAKALGAAHGINYKTTPDWSKAALELTGGEGVDAVIDVGGAATLGPSLDAIRRGGKVSIIGVLSGPPAQINAGRIFAKRANVQGISVGSTQMFEAMNAAIAANTIKPVIDRVFGFDEAKAAYHHLAAAGHFGKVVIRIG